MIEIRNVNFAYKKNRDIIKNLNFNLQNGKIYGILGHNGAGKTTLSKLIMGLLKPKSGYIKFHDLDNRISFLPETDGIYEKLTCFENVTFRARLSGLDSNQSKLESENVLKKVGLLDSKNEKASFLSQGMQKRLGLACAILNPANLIILDEPTNGVDPETLEKMKSLIRELSKKNNIILMTCHDLNTVEEVCTDIVIMQDGTLIYQGEIGNESLKDFYLDKTKGDKIE